MVSSVRAGWSAVSRAFERWAIEQPTQSEWQSPVDRLRIGNYRVKALNSALELARDGQAMRTCVASYTGLCRAGGYLVYSVFSLEQSKRVATIGLELGDDDLELAGGVAHDFNNILGAIIGYAEMALYDTQKNSMEHYNIDQVLKAGHRAKDLVKQILAFSRKSEQDKNIILLTPIVEEALKLLRASLPTTIEIKQHIEPRLDAIFADPTQMHQVMMNLCTNLAHAMDDMGGILNVELRNVDLNLKKAVQYSELNPGPYVQLSISRLNGNLAQLDLARGWRRARDRTVLVDDVVGHGDGAYRGSLAFTQLHFPHGHEVGRASDDVRCADADSTAGQHDLRFVVQVTRQQ